MKRVSRRWRGGLLVAPLMASVPVLAAPVTVPIASDEVDAAARAATAPSVQLLAEFSTHYLSDAEHHARAFNVELAAAAIDGRTIAPGATFSFNDAVGERTAAFGFERSVVLRDHMIAEGTGGGTCQVASTLHAAALLAGLSIVERTPHSRPSAYVRLGLDATVVYPRVDLKIRNPRGAPVVVRARATGGDVVVWIEGEGERPEVSITSEILERTPFPRTIERDPSIPPDTVRVKAYGIPGFRVQRSREVRACEGCGRRELRMDTYPPTAEVVVVSPSFDVTRLELRAPDATLGDDASDAGLPPHPLTYENRSVARPMGIQLRPAGRVVLDNRRR